jgi:hypothetical protein
MEEIQIQLKDLIADTSNPFFQKIFWLSREYPNDADLGKRVRNLINEIEEYNLEKAKLKADHDIQEILKRSKES